MMSVRARAGNRVLFIESTGVRAPAWKHRGRLLARLRKWESGKGRFRTVADNVSLYSPLALPFPYARGSCHTASIDSSIWWPASS